MTDETMTDEKDSDALRRDDNIIRFTAERAEEICKLTDAIENPNACKLVYQKLPRHMQRRAMSHNPRRLPQRLRGTFDHQKGNVKRKVIKRPSRLHRRRPSNLLNEYNRRQRNNVWLETHIWHAKRCHMIERWNYKLPNALTDKSHRATYRAGNYHCLAQDVSYLCHVELNGPENILIEKFNVVACELCSISVVKGLKVGYAFVNGLDGKPVAPVGCLWRPGFGVRQVWIWVHPAGYEQLKSVMISLFNLDKKVDESIENGKGCDQTLKTESKDTNKKSGERNIDLIKLEPKKINCVERFESVNVSMVILKDKLNRFRLTGPLSHVVLQSILKLCDDVNLESDCNNSKKSTIVACDYGKLNQTKMQDPSDEVESTAGGGDNDVEMKDKSGVIRKDTNDSSKWWKKYYSNSDHLKLFEAQNGFWKRLESVISPAELPPGFVIGLAVKDPRHLMPRKKEKMMHTTIPSSFSESIPTYPVNVQDSALWELSIRNQSTRGRVSTRDLNKLRSLCLVPGTEIPATSCVPVLLVLNKGSALCPAGWDIIIPSGWGMDFWVALQYSGARTCCIREASVADLERGSLTYPWDYPDTEAGCVEEKRVELESFQAYLKRPRKKRINYSLTRIYKPFSFLWNDLFNNFEYKKFTVIRSKSLLHVLQSLMQSNSEDMPRIENNELFVPQLRCTLSLNQLVCIRLVAESVGCPAMFARIYLPQLTDFEDQEQIMELQGEDRNKKEIEDGQKEMKKLRRKLKKKRDNKNAVEGIRIRMKAISNRRIELSLPQDRVEQSRNVIGFVKRGGYCHSVGRGVGIGMISLHSFVQLIQIDRNRVGKKLARNVVLVRNTNTLVFRKYKFTVITDL